MKWTHHARLPPSVCPQCAHKLDSAIGLEDNEGPKPGDFTICINCQAVMQFNSDLTLRLIPWDEVPDSLKPKMLQVIALMKRMVPVWKARRN